MLGLMAGLPGDRNQVDAETRYAEAADSPYSPYVLTTNGRKVDRSELKKRGFLVRGLTRRAGR
jgi:hypothetical protein